MKEKPRKNDRVWGGSELEVDAKKQLKNSEGEGKSSTDD